MKAEGLVEKPFVPKRRAFAFPPVETMGATVATVRNLTHGYGGRTLFRNVDLEIERGDRVAIIGPNGAGKSTLLRLLMGVEQPNGGGHVSLGEHGIVPNYFEQNQAEALNLNRTVLQTLVDAAPDAKENELKQLLGRMMFSGSAMDKRVRVLSGGEKARLALAKFMCTAGTLLVLDEPTNHLDIPSKEALEEAVNGFEGAVIAVSHDRYFLRQIANRVLLAEDETLKDFQVGVVLLVLLVVLFSGGALHHRLFAIQATTNTLTHAQSHTHNTQKQQLQGDYDYFLSKNEVEAEKMEVKAVREKKVAAENTKAKSKMTKAEKERSKKDKAKAFNEAAAGKGKGKAPR